MSDKNAQPERIHCNKCGHKTKHSNLFNKTDSGSEVLDDQGNSIDWSTTYDLFECCGCEHVTLRRSFWFSEWDGTEVLYFPPQVSRRAPDWSEKLPRRIEALIQETYNALHANSRSLAMMGARALVDMIIIEKVGDVGTFQQKLQALEREGYLSRLNRETLAAALDVGNAAAHRGHVPTTRQTNQVMDIVENLLHSTTLHESLQELRDGVPKREKKQSPPNPDSDD